MLPDRLAGSQVERRASEHSGSLLAASRSCPILTKAVVESDAADNIQTTQPIQVRRFAVPCVTVSHTCLHEEMWWHP
jgi:hypothetical protein